MNAIIATCCVLHNICQIFGEEFAPELLEETEVCIKPQVFQDASGVSDAPSKDADMIREGIVQYCQDTDLE